MSKNTRKPNQPRQESDKTSKEIPVNRIIPQELPVTYADGLVVQNRDGLFSLYFFQAKHPLAFTQEEINNIKSIDTVCVAQILLTPHQMEQNLKAMALNYERFLKKASEEDEENAEEETSETSE